MKYGPVQVQESSRRDLACGSPVFFVDQHEDSIGAVNACSEEPHIFL